MMMTRECMIMNIHSNFGNIPPMFIFNRIVLFLVVEKVLF